MFEVEGIEYELKFNMNRIELIEKALGTSVMAIATTQNAMLSIGQIKTFLAYGTKESGDDKFLKAKPAMDMAEKLLEANGYTPVVNLILTQLEEDCPFFFQAG